MIRQALDTVKKSQILEMAKEEMQQYFDTFTKCPTTANGGILGKSMTSYGRAFAEAGSTC